MKLRAKLQEWLAVALFGAAAGLPLGFLIRSIAFGSWGALLPGLAAGFACLIAATVVAPVPGKLAAAEVLKEARRFPNGAEVKVEGSDTRLEIERRRTWWGPRTLIVKYSLKDWDEAFDEVEADQGISTVPITAYDIYRWWGAMQLSDTVTLMSSNARHPWAGQERTSRWGRYRRELRNQWFQMRTGQMQVTEAEMRFLADELRRGKIA
ncbi:hypothetical protein [Nonomuraea glycinis]|uniref:hypothetical protein n=1 Tax=Nonomuraea glycinis TaxID=2047744 RepID=UPI0033A1202A